MKRKEKCAAIITVRKPGSMTLRGRKSIAAWMRRIAGDLETGKNEFMTSRFTARYIFSGEN